MSDVGFSRPNFTRSLYPDLRLGEPEPDVTLKPRPEFAHPDDASVLISAFRKENEIASYLSNQMNGVDAFKPEDGFDFQKAAKDAGHDQYLDRYAHVFNQRAADALTAQINQEDADNRVLAASGVFGTIMSGVAGLASPTTLLPGGFIARDIKGGASLLRGAADAALATSGAAALQEGALQATQKTRTPEESGFAIGGGAILGALLGSAGSGLARVLKPAERADILARLDRELGAPEAHGEFADPTIPIREAVDAGNARAAGVGADVPVAQTMDDLTIAGRATRKVAEETAFLNPGLRLMTNVFKSAREIGEKLYEVSLYLNKHFGPNAVRSPESVEDMVVMHQGRYASAKTQTEALWRAHRQAGGTLNNPGFYEEVGAAMQEGDKHAIPQVAQAAAIFRREVIQPLTRAAQKHGLLPADLDLKGAESYFTRVWDRQKIIGDEANFRKTIRTWLKGTLESEVARMTAFRDKRVGAIKSQIADLTVPAEQRAALLKSLPEELNRLHNDNADFHALDEGLSDMRREEAARRNAGDAGFDRVLDPATGKYESRPRGADKIAADIKNTTAAAGKEYADYVAKRFAIKQRMATLRRSVAGSADEVERLRGKLIDAEAANVGRLERLHKSLSNLDDQTAARDPSLLAETLSSARTTFAKILERSNAAHDRLANRLAKLRSEAEKTDNTGLPQREPVPADLSSILDNSRKPLPVDPRKTMSEKPVRAMLRGLGGVDPAGPLAAELKHAGITPQSAPGLFKKGGLQSADNLVGVEHELFRDHADAVEGDLAGKGYIKPDAIVEALKAEESGQPLRTAHELEALDDYQRHVDARDYYRESLQDMGIDVEKMSDAEIMDRLGNVAFQRKVLEQFDAADAARVGENEGGAQSPEPVTLRDKTVAGKQERALELFEAAERNRIAEMSKVSEQIATLEAADPQAALDLLRATVDQRLTETAGTVSREAVRMDRLAQRMQAADPKHVENLVKELEARARKIADDHDRRLEGLDAENGYASYLDDVEENITNTLTGRGVNPADLPHNLVVSKRGPLNERRLTIEDKLIRPWLDMNAERAMGRFVRVMGSEVELSRALKDTPDLKATFAKVEAEAKEKRAAVDANMSAQEKAAAHAKLDADTEARLAEIRADTTLTDIPGKSTAEERRTQAIANAEATRKAQHDAINKAPTMDADAKRKALLEIDQHKTAAVEDLTAMRDILRGTYKVEENNNMLARVLSVANTFNYMTRLGGSVVSSLNDALKPIMAHGLSAYMADGLAPLMTNLKAIKLSREDGLINGALAEKVTHGYIASMAEVLDPYARKSVVERFMDNMARVFSKYGNFIMPWTDWVKTLDYVMAQARVVRNVRNWSKLSENERAYMHLHHIDETLAGEISGQLDKYGSDVNGVTVANSHRWDNEAAQRAFNGAMIKDTRTNIVTPGIGDKPLMMHHPIGRAIGQFQSYTFASHTKIMLRSMQGIEKGVDAGRAGVIAGMVATTSMGMFIYWLKQTEAGMPLSDNPGTWIAEGLDRSGLLSAFFLANNTAEKLSGYGGYGAMASLFPGKDQGVPASRYRDRTLTGTLAGPTGELADNITHLIVHATQGKIGAADIRAIKRLAPFNGVPELASILNHYTVPAAIEAAGAGGK